MAKNSDDLAGSFDTENTGLLSGILAEEDELDRRALWRIGSWGVGAVGAVIVAVMANQSAVGWRRDQVAAADLTRQAQQIQTVAKESQGEARRLASAIETLSGDRDRLYSRVTTLEQGLDSVTGAIARQTLPPSPTAAPATAAKVEPPAAHSSSPAPAVAPVATTQATAASPEKLAAAEKPLAPPVAEPSPAAVSSATQGTTKIETAKIDTTKTGIEKIEAPKAPASTPPMPLMAAKSMMAPPDPAAGKLIEPSKPVNPVTAAPIPEVVASASVASDVDDDEEATAPRVALQRTEFAVDLGSANSLNGLRAMWRGLLKSKSNAPLTALRPIIVVREGNNGLGMQLRLVAGPVNDAGTAAKICAVLAENKRPCETTIFDGQRLSMKADEPVPASTKPAPAPRRRGLAKRAALVVVEEPPKTPETSTISSWFGKKGQ